MADVLQTKVAARYDKFATVELRVGTHTGREHGCQTRVSF